MINASRLFSSIFLRSELMKSASVLISGTILAQLVSILLQPLIRRLFSPSDFGVFTVYMSIVGICAIFGSLKYDDAIVLPRSDKESINLLGLSLILNLTINIIIFIAFICAGKNLISFFNLPADFPAAVLLVIPLGVFLSSSYSALNSWLIRKRKYVAVSVNKLVRRSFEGISQVSVAFFKQSNGLIYSDIIGQAANVATVSIQVRRNKLNLNLLSWQKIRYVIKKYSEFPKFNLLPALMSTCSYLLPPIFVNKYFSSESAGFFDLAKMVLSIPLAFIAASFSSVLLQRISEKFNNKESIVKDLKPVFYIVLVISALEIFAISIWGESIFNIAFGKQWNYSGTISRILVWSFAVNFMISSFTSLFIAMRRIKTYGIWQLLYFVAILSLVFFKNLPFESFLKLYVGIEISCYIIAGMIIVYILKDYEAILEVNKK
jgi:O-antigen/teichoic acid export membrane protein